MMTSFDPTKVSSAVKEKFPHDLWNLELGRILLVQEFNIVESDELLAPTPMELEIGDEELSLAYANDCLHDFYDNWDILGSPGSFEIIQGTYGKLLIKMGQREPWMTVIRKKS